MFPSGAPFPPTLCPVGREGWGAQEGGGGHKREGGTRGGGGHKREGVAVSGTN